MVRQLTTYAKPVIPSRSESGSRFVGRRPMGRPLLLRRCRSVSVSTARRDAERDSRELCELCDLGIAGEVGAWVPAKRLEATQAVLPAVQIERLSQPCALPAWQVVGSRE